MPISWLPVGGMTAGMIWGSSTARSFVQELMPSESAASICPLSTAANPPRMISAM